MDKDDVWRVLLSAWDTVRSAGQANLAQLRRGRNVGNGRCIPTLARASNRWTAGFFVCRQGLHETIPPFTKRGPSHTSLKSRHVHRSRSNGRGEALPLSLRRGDKTGEPRATKELDGCHGCPAASTTNGTLDPVPANDSRTKLQHLRRRKHWCIPSSSPTSVLAVFICKTTFAMANPKVVVARRPASGKPSRTAVHRSPRANPKRQLGRAAPYSGQCGGV